METNNSTFTTWLESEIENRGWTLRELARRSKLTHVAISNVLKGARNPGVEFCLKVARAFHVPPEQIFRRAGLLPPIENLEEALFNELRIYVESLSPERREEVLRYVTILHEMDAKKREDDAIDE